MRRKLGFWLLSLALPACGVDTVMTSPEAVGFRSDDTAAPDDTAGTDDTGDTAGADEVDADGDGFPAWPTARDPHRADCDDSSVGVTPTEEVYVPAGTFVRGTDGLVTAEPAREITLSAYCIDRTEVTNARFRQLLDQRELERLANVDDAGRPLFDVWDADDTYAERLSFAEGTWSVQPGYEEHPVVEVWAWSAAFYCERRGLALPTEAQWEKAARGDADVRAYPWGDEAPTCARADFAPVDPEQAEGIGPCVGDTVPVDSMPDGASSGGVVGLAGNVSEWVSDWFDPDGYATGPDVDPVGPDSGQLYDDGVGAYIARVSRGGGFLSPGDALHVSAREPQPEDATSNGVGFRCVRRLE